MSVHHTTRCALAVLTAPIIAALVSASAFAETNLSGFAELTHAMRVEKNIALDGGRKFTHRKYPRGDIRAQLRLSGGGERDEYFLRIDMLSDYALNRSEELTIREGYIKLYLADWLDAKIGRQVATWGTGDLLFVNDLFAKDWVAFFTGQELSYLKKPQDLVRLSAYKGSTTFEFAFSPYYTMDNLPTGRRLSIFNPFMGQTVNYRSAPYVSKRERAVDNAEVFGRISGYAGATEWSLYGYHGFYPQPLEVEPGPPPHLAIPKLASGGASLRGSIGAFLVNVEGAYYFSRDDNDGDNPLIPNSSVRGLVGIERNLGTTWTVASQWFADFVRDFDKIVAETSGSPGRDEIDHTVTLRIRKSLSQETVRVNLFGFWGLSAEDYYLRGNVEYDYSDNLRLTLGGNWIDGDQPHTMFGQFRGNSNVYVRLRRSF